MTPAELLELRITGVITAKQYDVLNLRLRGLSQRQIALALRISREAVRDRERAGTRRIADQKGLAA